MARRTILTPQAKLRKEKRDAELRHAQGTCLDDLLPPEDRSTAHPKLVNSDRRQAAALDVMRARMQAELEAEGEATGYVSPLLSHARMRSNQQQAVLGTDDLANDELEIDHYNMREHQLELLQIYRDGDEDRQSGNWLGIILVIGVSVSLSFMAYAALY